MSESISLRVPERMRLVLELLSTAKSEKEIATATGICRHTVHSHIKSIYRIAGVQSRPELLIRLMGESRHAAAAPIIAAPVAASKPQSVLASVAQPSDQFGDQVALARKIREESARLCEQSKRLHSETLEVARRLRANQGSFAAEVAKFLTYTKRDCDASKNCSAAGPQFNHARTTALPKL